MHTIFLTLAVLATIAGLTGTANASNVTSLNPQSIVLALQNAGYKAALGKTDDGDPAIDTASDGNNIRIVMMNCKNHSSCDQSEFVGAWDCSDEVEKCKTVASDTNNSESPVHVILLNGGKTVATYSYLMYDNEGISEELLIKNLTIFSYYNNKFSYMVSKK